MTAHVDRPRLRKVERYTIRRDDDVLVILRDPTGISDQVAFPQEAAALLDALDGQRTVPQIRQSLFMRGVADFSLDEVEALVNDLGEAGYLDDVRFRRRWEAALAEFLANPVRRPRFAGLLYPDEPEPLRAAMSAAIPDPAARIAAGSDVIGVLLPYQPIADLAHPAVKGSAPLAAAQLADRTLRELPPPDAFDLVVLLGTDYHPGLLPFTVTDKRYATPDGELPGDPALVRELERRLPWVRREEIRHREAMSLELAALALRHMYGSTCPPVLPVLCAPSALTAGAHGGDVDAFLATMEHVLEGRRVFWWIAAELAHAGPAYGRPLLPPEAVKALEERDLACLRSLAGGRPEQLARRCQDDDATLGRPSGAAALATVARLLPVGYRAELVDYTTGRPPGPDEGWVGLCGMRFRRPLDPATDE